MSLKTKTSILLFFLTLNVPALSPADISSIESVIDNLSGSLIETAELSSQDIDSSNPSIFFESKLVELNQLNKEDQNAKNASETIRLFNQKSYSECVLKSKKNLDKSGFESIFFVFEFSFGVKCVSQLYDQNKIKIKTIKDWSDMYFKMDLQTITKKFHGTEMDLFLSHYLKLSEILFLNLKELNLNSEQISYLSSQLQNTKSAKVKKELFMTFLNKNDHASAKSFLTQSDPDLLDLNTLAILQEHFKEEIYARRVDEIKKSKIDSNELKRLYSKNKYDDFLNRLKVTNLILETDIDSVSRQLGWLFVRGSPEFRNKVLNDFDSLSINHNQFFWVLSNQGLFKDIIIAFKKLDSKKKINHISMGMKAYIYSGKYSEGYEFIKDQKIIDNLGSYTHSALFYSSMLMIRFNKDKESIVILNHLINSDSEYKLQAMYLKYNIYKDLKKSEFKSVAKDLVSNYPLTFYGLYVAHIEDLTSVLPFISSKPLASLEFNFDRSEEKRKLKHLAFVFENKIDRSFRKSIDSLLMALSFESQIIWAYKFKKEDQPLAAIKIMNHVWTSRRDLIHPSIIPIAYPVDYLPIVKKHSVSDIDPYLVLGLIRQESAFQKNATSPSRARGLMQLLSGTAREVARSLRLSKVSLPWGLYSPEVNIRLGSYYLRKRIEAYQGHVPLALASYNVGPGRLQKWSIDRNTLKEVQENINSTSWKIHDLWVEEMPWEETRFYVKAVMRNYMLYLIFENYQPLKACFRVWNCDTKSELENTANENFNSSRIKSI